MTTSLPKVAPLQWRVGPSRGPSRSEQVRASHWQQYLNPDSGFITSRRSWVPNEVPNCFPKHSFTCACVTLPLDCFPLWTVCVSCRWEAKVSEKNINVIQLTQAHVIIWHMEILYWQNLIWTHTSHAHSGEPTDISSLQGAKIRIRCKLDKINFACQVRTG